MFLNKSLNESEIFITECELAKSYIDFCAMD